MNRSDFALPDGTMSFCHWTYQESHKGKNPSPPVLLWAHANGFNALTYAPLFERLRPHASIYACDLRGHGFTRLPATAQHLRGWQGYRDDVLALLAHLSATHKQKIWLGGHSMGGYTALYAAATRPDLVAGVIVADPVILPPQARYLRFLPTFLTPRTPATRMAVVARKRRQTWQSIAEIRAAYQGRGAFTHWREGFLDAYLEGGVLPTAQGVRLACSPEWEALNYETDKIDLSHQIRNLPVPLTLLRAAQNSTTYNIAAFKAAATPDKKIAIVPNSTHFLPMEYPEIICAEILARFNNSIG